jgi:ribonuclease D
MERQVAVEDKWEWVDARLKLKRARENIARSSVICIDTEYDSFRYFREKLCLIQIKTGEKTYLFDPLNSKLDISFLSDIFPNPEQVKVMHAGDNDIRILNRDYGFEFVNVFDTHRAASLLGSKYLSLVAVVHQYLGIKLLKAKKLQRSRWEVRPLTEEQIQYAVQDTQYLIDLYRKLKQEIESRGQEQEAARLFDDVARVRWIEKKLGPKGYMGIMGYEDLKGDEKRRLRNLYQWRFRKAREINMAVFMILSDQELVDLSRSESPSRESLTKAGILSPKKASAFGREIVAVLRQSRDEDSA